MRIYLAFNIVHQQGMFADILDKIDTPRVFEEVGRVLRSGGIYVLHDFVHPLQQDGFLQVRADLEYPWAAYRKR